MMPARYRGRTDIWINGTYWLGAILGTFASFLLLNSMRPNEGWRVAFLMGPALAFVILIVRRNLPESPRAAGLVPGCRKRQRAGRIGPVSAGSARAAGESRPDSIRIAIQIDASTKATDTSTVAIATPIGMLGVCPRPTPASTGSAATMAVATLPAHSRPAFT